MSDVPDLWSVTGDEVAAVNPDDLRKVCKMINDVQAYNPGQGVILNNEMYARVCSPAANVMAVWYRASMLGLLQMLPEPPLAPWTHHGGLDDAVFQVAAAFPMKNMGVGVVHEGPPFDMQEFLKQIEAASTNKK